MPFVDETYRDSSWAVWDVARDGDTLRVEVISSEGYFGDSGGFELDMLHLARAVHVLIFVPNSYRTSDVYCEYDEQGVNDIFYAPNLGQEKARILFGLIEGHLIDEEQERVIPLLIDLRCVRDPQP